VLYFAISMVPSRFLAACLCRTACFAPALTPVFPSFQRRSIPADQVGTRMFLRGQSRKDTFLTLTRKLADVSRQRTQTVQRKMSGGASDAVVDRESEAEQRICTVRCMDGEQHMSIVLDIAGKTKSMNRMQEDSFTGALDRLAKLWAEALGVRKGGGMGMGKKKKAAKGKGKRRQAEAAAAQEQAEKAAAAAQEEQEELQDIPIDVKILDTDGIAIDGDFNNRDVWLSGYTLSIQRGEVTAFCPSTYGHFFLLLCNNVVCACVFCFGRRNH
jgi:hypothetical protein